MTSYHTPLELGEHLEKATKKIDLLCCTVHMEWIYSLCAHPVCIEHLRRQHFCIECEEWLLSSREERLKREEVNSK